MLRGSQGQRLRIATGLILFGFALTHLINHAVGLFGLDAMMTMQNWRTLVTRSWPVTLVLAGALLAHIALSVARIAQRTTWRMETWEAAQIAFGLLIPLFLLPHVIETRVAHRVLGINDTYAYELARMWSDGGWSEIVLLMIVWAHGVVGIHYWLRLHPLYRRLQPIALVVAVIVPLAALAGYMVAGREVAALNAAPEGLAALKEMSRWPDAAGEIELARIRANGMIAIWCALLVFAGYLAYRAAAMRRAPKITVRYVGGPTVSAPLGSTLLEISRMNRIPHAAICGGRSRCSTCRVRIDQGAEKLLPADYAEQSTLDSIGAAPNVRLACQVRPKHDLTVARLLHPSQAVAALGDASEPDSDGVERILALMFLDMRNFTQHMERKLPYDVVYILNEFFAATGKAITSNGGVIDKFQGDGLLAVFGRSNGPETGCREALQAARAIDLALDHFNAKMADELGEPMRVGIGIHAGPLLLGRIGWGETIDMTVIGHTVNAASRLEALTKAKSCQLIISRDVAEYAGWHEAATTGESIHVRGIAKPIEIIAVSRGRDLPPQLLGSVWPN